MDLKYIYTELEKERGKNCIITLMRNGLKSSIWLIDGIQ